MTTGQDQKVKGQGHKLTLRISSKKATTIECGPMPNVIAALPNTGGALCSTPQFG